jgi:hypothetical protein
VEQYLEHYHTERPHQEVGNMVLDPLFEPAELNGNVVSDEQLGGLIRSYRRVEV